MKRKIDVDIFCDCGVVGDGVMKERIKWLIWWVVKDKKNLVGDKIYRNYDGFLGKC